MINSDWHIHSRNSCDSACMTVSDLIAEAEQSGIVDFGLTDHVHTPFNLPDLALSRAEFISNIPSPHFHFGVEVSCVSKWEIEEVASGRHENPVYGVRSGGRPGCEFAIGLTEEDIREHGVEYVVGGTHWPMYVPLEREAVIRDYHRQNMFLALHPLIDIVAHPWWWMGHWKDANGSYPAEPWFDNFKVIPKSMHDEFAAAAAENGTAVEINISANLMNPNYPESFPHQYLEYLAFLQSRKVKLSIGSDCHKQHYYEIDFAKAGDMVSKAGIKNDFWQLAPTESSRR